MRRLQKELKTKKDSILRTSTLKVQYEDGKQPHLIDFQEMGDISYLSDGGNNTHENQGPHFENSVELVHDDEMITETTNKVESRTNYDERELHMQNHNSSLVVADDDKDSAHTLPVTKSPRKEEVRERNL